MALYLVTLRCIPRANLNFYWTFTSDILKTNKMKKLVVIFSLALVLMSSCISQKKGASTYNDDVYANPKEDKIEDARIAAEKKKAQDAADKRYNDSIAAVQKAQKEKDDANPYYKDRPFKYDDYYDYEYATRVRRFNNNINGLGYYDNYYTNSYWYNSNPYNYGVSVYNGYSWWGPTYNSYSYNPSVNFYNNWGWGCNPGYGYYSGYNPYMAGYAAGYNNGFYNGYYGYPYGYGYGSPYYGGYYNNPYGYYGYGGYYNNYYNYNNNGWGYYNAYDHNSSYTYGPRSSYGGGNSRRTSNPGNSVVKREGFSDKDKFIASVAEQQVRETKFTDPVNPRTPKTEIANPRVTKIDEPIRVDNNGNPVKTDGVRQPVKTDMYEPVRDNSTKTNEPVRNYPVKTYDDTPIKDQQPVQTKGNDYAPVKQVPVRNPEPVKQVESYPRFEMPTRNSNPTPNFPSNNGGGGSAPSGGGGHRPR